MKESYNQENIKENITLGSAVESLGGVGEEISVWGEDVMNNPERIRQAELRFEVSQSLSSVYDAVPDATVGLQESVLSSQLDKSELQNLYSKLTELFNDDELNNKLALYLPFELLSDVGDSTGEDNKKESDFIESYKKAWQSLLTKQELRAGYFDGDVPELGQSEEDNPLVVKAAHLVPILIEKGVLTMSEVVFLLESTTDHVLRQSLSDSLFVLQDKQLLTGDSLDELRYSSNSSVAKIGEELYLDREKEGESETELVHESNLIDYLNKADLEWQGKEQSIHRDTNLTDGRKEWLSETEEGLLMSKQASQLSKSMVTGDVTVGFLQNLLTYKNDMSALGRNTILKAFSGAVNDNIQNKELSESLFKQYKPMLDVVYEQIGEDTGSAFSEVVYHLYAQGLFTDLDLVGYGLERPLLGASSSEIIRAMKDDVSALDKALDLVRESAELQRLIYPVFVTLGSRMKGYATEQADFDVAVFVRPGTGESERPRLQELLLDVLGETKAEGKAMEFWLEEIGGEEDVTIKNYDNPDPQRGDNTLVHPLTGHWQGDESAIKELYEKLMPQYLYSAGQQFHGQDMRSIWLEEIEHNLLKYRLMHKGYQRFAAPQGGIKTVNSDKIDGDSAFYDSGYRRLATKIFVDKVFLPQLEKVGE